jgi:acyl-CoA reductase-like NAD-dependent aldehyde dehydrogenase
MAKMTDHLSVYKTYKNFIGGNYERGESGAVREVVLKSGPIKFPESSRKDFRNAVSAAQKAQAGWVSRSAYNRGQIIYRIAEMLQSRQPEFIAYLIEEGFSQTDAQVEIEQTVDRIVYLAGWADKFEQVLSSVNAVNGPYFVSTQVEPIGVVALLAPEEGALLSFITRLLAAVVVGNSAVLVTDHHLLSRLAFAEVLQTSDLPAGVINIISGNLEDLSPTISSHKEIRAVDLSTHESPAIKNVFDDQSSINLKRVLRAEKSDWAKASSAQASVLNSFCESKTIWHPLGF